VGHKISKKRLIEQFKPQVWAIYESEQLCVLEYCVLVWERTPAKRRLDAVRIPICTQSAGSRRQGLRMTLQQLAINADLIGPLR
jgi:hypothetical protein